MNTTPAEQISLVDEATEPRADTSLDLPLAMQMPSVRFGSPAGIAFLPALGPTLRLRRKR